jgi:hypothetical protein
VPFEAFWREEREKVVAGEMHEFVSDAYAELNDFSPAFRQEFREFWQMPDDIEGANNG